MSKQKQNKAIKLLQRGFQEICESRAEAALVSCQAALEIYRKIDDQIGEACALNNIGIVCRFQAAYSYWQATTIFEELKSNGQGVAEEQLGSMAGKISWIISERSENDVLIIDAKVRVDPREDAVPSTPPIVDPIKK